MGMVFMHTVCESTWFLCTPNFGRKLRNFYAQAENPVILCAPFPKSGFLCAPFPKSAWFYAHLTFVGGCIKKSGPPPEGEMD